MVRRATTLASLAALALAALLAPAATPAPIVSRLRAEVVKFAGLPETRAKLNETGPEPWVSTPEEFAAIMRRDYEKDGRLVKALGVKLD